MDPQALVAQQKQQFNDLLNSQKNEQQGLFNTYSQKVSAQPKLTDVFTQKQQEAGIGDLRNSINLFNTQVSGVKSLIDRLNENTSARTVGTNTNQAYLDRIRAVEGGGLNTQLSRLAAGMEPVVSAYNTNSDQIGQYMQLTQQQQANELKPYELQINALGDRFAREITGFTKNKEDELTVLMDKLNRDRELADREWQRAQQLASEEREFARQRSYLAAQSASQGSAITSKTDPIQQRAYDDVRTRIDRGDNSGTLMSDYLATAASAKNGNIMDRYKLQLYRQLRPDLFKTIYPWEGPVAR